MGYPGRNNIYEATIKRMVAQALEEQEQAFLEAHGDDTDEELLSYLRQCAARLGHTPWPKEIAGGCYIEQRFRTWSGALLRAQLPRPNTPDQASCFARVQEERARQEAVYRRRKAEKKQRAQKRQAQQAKKKQPD